MNSVKQVNLSSSLTATLSPILQYVKTILVHSGAHLKSQHC